MVLSVIIPLYNEEDSIIEVIKKLMAMNLPHNIERKEIIIVDDCSEDNSYKNVEEFISNLSDIKLFKHNKNKGKGAAVKTGINNSTGDIFIIQDADTELDPQDIPKMIEVMNELNIEFVNGSRYIAGINRTLSSYKRYLANKLFTFLTSIMINVKITDVACGYKLFKKTLYDKLHLQEDRFGFEAELIIKALRVKKNNVAEVPVKYFPRNEGEGKKLKNSDAFKILWVIFKYGMLRLR